MSIKAVKRWIYVFSGMVMYMCLGTVYSWSIFRTPLEQKLGILPSASGLPYLVFLICFTISMLLMGKATDRVNPRILILIGGLMVGTGWILSGLTESFALIVVFNGILAGSGVGTVYGAPIKFISSMFTGNRGMAIGLLVGGFGLSPFITAPISKTLINNIGVSNAFIVLGISFIILIPLLGWSFNNPAERIVSKGSSEKESLSSVLKSSRFIGLWFCFLIASTSGLMTIGVSSQIGVQVFGIDSTTTAFLLSVFAIFNALGRPSFGYITDRLSPLAASLTSFSLIIIGSSLLLFSREPATAVYVVALSLLWLNLGAWLAIAPATTANFFGGQNYSRNYGIIFSAYGLGALIGTPMAEFIRTQYGSYRFISVPIIIAAAIGLFVAIVTMRSE